MIASALCASIAATTIFPDNGTAFAASLEAATETAAEDTKNLFMEEMAAAAEPTEAAEVEIEPEEIIEGSEAQMYIGSEGGAALIDEADPDISLFSAANEVGEIEADEVAEAAIVEEDLDKRDVYQKEFKLEDNTRLLVMYPEAVHYEKDGEWEEIDNRLIPARNEEGEMVLTNRANAVDMELPPFLFCRSAHLLKI